MEASILLVKCLKNRRTFGVRIQKMKDGDWWRTWAFKLNENQAKSEGYDRTQAVGNLYATEDYPGCPHCGTKSFVQCHNCNKISCWNGEKKLQCAWCGTMMDNITSATEKFTVDSGEF